MKKFKAIVKMTTWLEAEIEAKDEIEAYDIADNMDGGDFTEKNCSWEIDRVEEIK